MPSVPTRLGAGVERAVENLPLAVVPLVVSLLQVDKIQRILASDGIHVGIKFGLPFPVLTVWQFVSLPGEGVAMSAGLPVGGGTTPVSILAGLAGILVTAVLSAGYFGSLVDALAGRQYAFASHVRDHFVSFLVITVAPIVAFAPIALVVMLGTPGAAAVVVVVGLLVVFVLGYLFYATPYLLVLRETSLLDAAEASVAFAKDGGPYARYFVGFVLVVVLVSPIATAVVVNVPVIGMVIGVPAGAVAGLAGNIATARFVADIDPESPDFGEWPGDDPTGAGDQLPG